MDAVGHEAADAKDRDTVGGAMMVRLRGTDLCVDVTDGKLIVHNPLQVRTLANIHVDDPQCLAPSAAMGPPGWANRELLRRH